MSILHSLALSAWVVGAYVALGQVNEIPAAAHAAGCAAAAGLYLALASGGLAKLLTLAITAAVAAAPLIIEIPRPRDNPGLPSQVGLAAKWLWETRVESYTALQVAGLIVAAACAVGVLALFIGAARTRALPRRLWFARYDPTFGTAYAPHAQSHGPVGLVFVVSDSILRDKLVWLYVGPEAEGVRVGGTATPAVGVRRLKTPVEVFRRGGRWRHSGLGDPAVCRLLPILSADLPADPPSDIRWQSVEKFPVRDVFERDNYSYGKKYGTGRAAAPLLGVLIHVRLNGPVSDQESDHVYPPPEAVVFLRDQARTVRVEYPPDQIPLGADLASGILRVTWRGHELAFDPLDSEPTATAVSGRAGVEVLLFLPAGVQAGRTAEQGDQG